MGPRLVEIEVGDDQVRVVGGEGVDDAVVIGEGKDLVAVRPKHFGDHLHHGQFIVHQNDFRHGLRLRGGTRSPSPKETG